MENQIATIEKVTEAQVLKHLDNLGLTSKLNDGEKNTYLEVCKAFNLNPFKREIHVSKYGDQMAIITGFEVYIKRAERSGQLDGWSVITDGKIDDNSLKAVITIHRKDRKIPFVHEVYYYEYVQKNSQGQPNKFWQKAHTMIKKVAMSQGFRLCFCDELGGMPYTSEELPQQEESVSYVDVKKELQEKYYKMVSEAGHVLSKEEMEEYTIKYLSWPEKKLQTAIDKLRTIILDREEKILSENHAKQIS